MTYKAVKWEYIWINISNLLENGSPSSTYTFWYTFYINKMDFFWLSLTSGSNIKEQPKTSKIAS